MMKRFLLGLMIIASAMASCSKDSVSAEKFSAKIDGKSWSAKMDLTNLTSDVFVISGTSLTGEVLVITIKGNAPDLYEFSTTSFECNATYKKSVLSGADDIYTSISGRVNLTKVDMVNKKISGTFDFSLAKLALQVPIAVSNGVFNDLSFTVSGI